MVTDMCLKYSIEVVLCANLVYFYEQNFTL